MLLYPRLPQPTARVLLEGIAGRSPSELRRAASLGPRGCTYAETGGNRATEADIRRVRDRVREVADEHGFPAGRRRDRLAFDSAAGVVLHELMRIVPGDAAEPGVWAFMGCVALPDVVAWRFPDAGGERFLGGVRNALGRLWWRAHILDTPEQRLTEILGEDEQVQLTERPVSVLADPRVARSIAREHLRLTGEAVVGQRMRLFRDAAKRLLRLSSVVCVDALDDESLDDVSWRILRESAAALFLQPGHMGPEVPRWSLLTAASSGGPEEDSGAPSSRASKGVKAGGSSGAPGTNRGLSGAPGASDASAPGAATAVLVEEQSAVPPATHIVFRSLEGRPDVGITELRLGDVRHAIVEAANSAPFPLHRLEEVTLAALGIDAGLSAGEVRELHRLANSADARGWIHIAKGGDRLVLATQQSEGVVPVADQLMAHSLAEIAGAILASTASASVEGLEDMVLVELGHEPPCGRTSAKIIWHVAHDLANAGLIAG